MAKSGWGQRRSRRPDVDEEVQSSIGEVCTRMMPMTTMMSMELNEGVDDDDADGANDADDDDDADGVK